MEIVDKSYQGFKPLPSMVSPNEPSRLLAPPPPPSGRGSKKLLSKRAELAAEIERLGERRRKLEADTQAFRDGAKQFTALQIEDDGSGNEDVSAADKGFLLGAQRDELLGRQVDLLKTEAGIRRRAAELNGEIRREMEQLREKSHDTFQKVQAEVESKLEQIGYVRFQNHTPTPGRWFPNWVASHPRVREARGRYEEMRNRLGTDEWRPENERGLQQAERRLKEVHARLVKL